MRLKPKFNINVKGSELPEDECLKAIKQSDIYVALLTPSSIKDERFLREFNYAKSLNKYSLLCVQKGTNVPPEMFSGLRHEWIEFERDEAEELGKIVRDRILERAWETF